MRRNLIFLFLMGVMLLSPGQAWTQDLPMEGDVIFPGEEDFPYSTQPGWGMSGQTTREGQRLFFHGYGELQYKSPINGGKANMDFHRFVWGISYEISENIMLHTEVDFEHAANEMELEFAYLDFSINPAFNVRAGSMLMPVGLLNEYHEPPLFYSVKRPTIHNKIIPTTWQEGGIGVFGTVGEGFLKYRIYLVSGLNGKKFRGKDGIRKGRGKVAGGENQPMSGEELAVVGRFEFEPVLGLSFGTSFYHGGVDQEIDIAGSPAVTIYEFDGRVRMGGVDFQAIFAQVDIDNAESISNATCKNDDPSFVSGTFTQSTTQSCETVGDRLIGWHVELAYHLSHLTGTTWDLVPFVRYAEINTQDSVGSGSNQNGVAFVADKKNDKEIITSGIAYYPHPQVVFKAGFQNVEDASSSNGAEDSYNLGMAYMF